MITGIASPEHMVADFEGKCKKLVLMKFPDHHFFTASDVEAINMQFRMMEKPAVIITTEKDGVRLTSTPGLSDIVRKSLYIQPIEVQFIQDEDKFIDQISKYVHKNNRNGSMAQEAGLQHGIAVPRPTLRPRPQPIQQPEPTTLPDAEDSDNTRNWSRPSDTGNRGGTGIPIQRHPSFPGFNS